MYPIRGIFFGCCASAMAATASSTTTNRTDKTRVFFIAHMIAMYHAGGGREKVRFTRQVFVE
jgi:hypothetical protein